VTSQRRRGGSVTSQRRHGGLVMLRQRIGSPRWRVRGGGAGDRWWRAMVDFGSLTAFFRQNRATTLRNFRVPCAGIIFESIYTGG